MVSHQWTNWLWKIVNPKTCSSAERRVHLVKPKPTFMEQTSNTSLFSLSIDPITKAHLSEAAKWARFLSIVGMILLVLMVVFGLFMATMMSSTMGQFDSAGYSSYSIFSALGPGIAVIYIIMAVIAFFPLLFLLRFANKARAALAGNDQQALNTSFQNLKVYFRYIGILVIIWLAFIVIGFLFGIMGSAAFS
jgi:hypothetical protein